MLGYTSLLYQTCELGKLFGIHINIIKRQTIHLIPYIQITEKQKDYIRILSGYADTKEADERDIENYLKEHGKKTVSQLSKKEASDLIKILLQRPAEYTFPCG